MLTHSLLVPHPVCTDLLRWRLVQYVRPLPALGRTQLSRLAPFSSVQGFWPNCPSGLPGAQREAASSDRRRAPVASYG